MLKNTSGAMRSKSYLTASLSHYKTMRLSSAPILQRKVKPPVLVICPRIVKTGCNAVYAHRINHRARSAPVCVKKAEYRFQRPVCFPRKISALIHTLCLRIGIAGKRAPVMRKCIAQAASFPEPEAVPMADRYLIHMIIRLKALEQIQYLKLLQRLFFVFIFFIILSLSVCADPVSPIPAGSEENHS